jgi:hypothetical protein
MLVHWGFVILSQIGFVHVEVSMPVVDVCGGTAVMSECLERICYVKNSSLVIYTAQLIIYGLSCRRRISPLVMKLVNPWKFAWQGSRDGYLEHLQWQNPFRRSKLLIWHFEGIFNTIAKTKRKNLAYHPLF